MSEPREGSGSGKIVLGYPAPPEHFARLRALAPKYQLVRAQSMDEAQAAVSDATVFLGNRFFLESLPFAKALRWMQSSSAGMDVILADELARVHPFVLTAARGVYDEEMADHAVALLYALLRDLPGALAAARTGTWARGSLPHLAGRKVLVFGFGGVGQAIARRLVAAKANVTAVRRSAGPLAAATELGVACVDTTRGIQLLQDSDAVLLAVPLTRETRALFGADTLARLKDGAYLVNIARGELLDQAALERELGRLGGVGLDVCSPEPLPPEHWLWRHPKALVTPHVARSPDSPAPAYLGLFERNLAAFVAGQPLSHVVKKELGY
jgi:phosphoglycerate dehydrogenase-like enzyme